MSNPFAPANETSDQLFIERGWLQGAIVGGVGYGMDLILFAMCFWLLVWHSAANNRLRWILLVFSCLIFICTTLFMGSLAQFTQMAFIDNRDFPGGPGGYENAMFSVPQSELGNVAFVVQNWLSDAMLVWRCYVIYRGCTYPIWLVMFFPFITYLTSFTLGLLWLLQISASSPFGASMNINWTVPYFTLSLSLNILLTLAIVARLFVHKYRVKKTLGANYGSHYTSIAAMVTESALMYSTFSLLFLIPFGINNPVSTVFLQSLCQIQAASSLLIVFRVAQGKGWSGQTAQSFTTGIPGSSAGSISMHNLRFRGDTTTVTTLTGSTTVGHISHKPTEVVVKSEFYDSVV